VADGVTGRRRREKRGTVLEVVCDAHPAPQILIRPALDERGLTMTALMLPGRHFGLGRTLFIAF
jgi:hypothetical protein